jgi:hypothetical protein
MMCAMTPVCVKVDKHVPRIANRRPDNVVAVFVSELHRRRQQPQQKQQLKFLLLLLQVCRRVCRTNVSGFSERLCRRLAAMSVHVGRRLRSRSGVCRRDVRDCTRCDVVARLSLGVLCEIVVVVDNHNVCVQLHRIIKRLMLLSFLIILMIRRSRRAT